MYTGTPYPMSAVTPLIGKQQEINKAHQIMLHNANLASNLRWMYEEGSVPEEEWEQYSSSPGALLKYRQGFTPPTPVLPAPINNAFYTITQEGKGDAEYIAGVPSSMMGFTQDQTETYRGLLANDEFGTRRLKAWMGSVVEPALEHLGRCFQMLSQHHYSVEKVFRIAQPEAGQLPDEEKEVRINIPIYNDYGKAISVFKDYSSARFDIRIVAGTTMPINRWALLEEYFRWFQAGLIDDIAMIAETDIRNKKQVIERKSMYSQLQGQVSSMEESLKDKDGTIETLERQLVQAGIKMKVGEASNEVRKDVLQTEAQQKLLRGILKAEFDRTKQDLKEGITPEEAE
jgi:DNA-binding MarR family transcriptional regulator